MSLNSSFIMVFAERSIIRSFNDLHFKRMDVKKILKVLWIGTLGELFHLNQPTNYGFGAFCFIALRNLKVA